MRKEISTILSILFLLSYTISLQAQQEKYFTGLLLNDSAYAQIPQKPVLLTRSYDILPKSYSLRQYCPIAKNQGNNSTCTSWASAYAARTISEAVANNWQSNQAAMEAFSPLFVYSLVRGESNGNCQAGIYLNAAFEVLKKNGVVKYQDFNYDCSSEMSIPSDLYLKAGSYTIDDYFALFSMTDPYLKKINTTKKSISENRPVVISMKNYNSFQKNDEEIWSGITDSQDGYHAMCVVGYDDNKYGGAFLLMNSWGTRWGDGGFKWVRYADYSENVNYAMEMYVRKKDNGTTSPQPPTPAPILPKPNPVSPAPKPILNTTVIIPSAQSERVNLAGELHFILSTGTEMHPKLHTIKNNLPYYKMRDSYISGTRYRLYLYNNEPAYVYVIGSDLKNTVTKVFPPDNHISPALVYSSNDIAIPDENWYIEMDNTTGKDYVCVLYSRDELPIDNIIVKIEAVSGSFFEKVNKALADKMAPIQTINYNNSTIKFNVKNTDKTLVRVIVEIDHQ